MTYIWMGIINTLRTDHRKIRYFTLVQYEFRIAGYSAY